jgi:hypothetical protein
MQMLTSGGNLALGGGQLGLGGAGLQSIKVNLVYTAAINGFL